MLSPNQTYIPEGRKKSFSSSAPTNSRSRRYSALIGQVTLTVSDEQDNPQPLSTISSHNSTSMISLPRIGTAGQNMYLFDGYEDHTLDDRHKSDSSGRSRGRNNSQNQNYDQNGNRVQNYQNSSSKTQKSLSKQNLNTQSSTSNQNISINNVSNQTGQNLNQSTHNLSCNMYLSPKTSSSSSSNTKNSKSTKNQVTFHPSASNQPSNSSLQVPGAGGMGQRRNTMPSLYTEDDDNISIISDSSSMCSKVSTRTSEKRRTSIIDDIIRSQNTKLYSEC